MEGEEKLRLLLDSANDFANARRFAFQARLLFYLSRQLTPSDNGVAPETPLTRPEYIEN